MIFNEKGYLLHKKKAKGRSTLYSFFTEHHGKMYGSAFESNRGAKKNRHDLHLFFPLLLEFEKPSSSSLPKIKRAEAFWECALPQCHKKQLAGLYINELLFKLLELNTPYPNIYSHYDRLMRPLEDALSIKEQVRTLEWALLEDLGYGIQFPNFIDPKQNYIFDPANGAIQLKNKENIENDFQYWELTGSEVNKLYLKDFSSKETSRSAKVLFLRQLRWHTSINEIFFPHIFSKWKMR